MIGTTITNDHSAGMWVMVMTPSALFAYGQVAVREVDHLHDPEHQRQAAGEQRVEPARQDALDDGVDPVHNVPASPGGAIPPRPPLLTGGLSAPPNPPGPPDPPCSRAKPKYAAS